MNKQIKAYIFDMDGTLVDNCAYHVKAWRKFSKKYGHELTEREILDWMGAQGGYYIERIMGKPLPKEEVDRLCFEKEEIYRKIYKPKLPEGLREWLDYAHARKIKLALATGGPKENVAFILDTLDLRKDFEVIVDATMYEKSKPAPDCFLKAAELLGVAPEDCRVYEDALNGIGAAKAAGMQCHVVTFTNPYEVLADAGADKIFDSYKELKIFPVKPERTAADERNLAYLDMLRKCEGEAMPATPLCCVVKVVAYEEVPLANEKYALVTAQGPSGTSWKMCIERGTIEKDELGLFISPNAALPDEDRYRENFKVKERVYKYGFGAKEHVEIPIVSRGIYHNNPGLLAPLDDFPELKRAKTGDLVAEKLRIQDVRELSTRAANKPAKPKSFTPKTLKPKKRPSALSFFEKVRKHRIEFFKKNGK